MGFLQDNARIHTAQSTRALFEQLGFWVVDHPPHSPDFNPIKYLWVKLQELVFEFHAELRSMLGGGKEKGLEASQ